MKQWLMLGCLVMVAVGCPGDSTDPDDGDGDGELVECSANEPVCPEASSTLGYSGGAGAPTITPTSSQTTVSTSNSSQFVSGSTSATSNGNWFIVVGNALRSSGVLPVSGGEFDAEIPLFCGTQQVVLSFASGTNRAYFRSNVTQTSCTAAQFRVQLSWDTNNSDIDLHLIRPNGTVGSSNDCHWTNCDFGGLEWGAAGAPGNPELDVDNTSGFGPENITIGSGAEAGEYRIVIDNFSETPATRATVKIFINEVEVQRFTSQTLDASASRTFWQAARVNIQTGVVTSINTYSAAQPARVIGGLKRTK